MPSANLGLTLTLLCLLSGWSSLYAQNGPAGVGDASSNKVWLDASALTGFSNGAKVASWTDRSGNGWNANQSNVTNRPSYLSNGLNGKPVLHFDRTVATQYVEITSAGVGSVMSNSNTIFAVAKANSGASNTNSDGQAIFVIGGANSGIRFYGSPTANALTVSQWVGSLPDKQLYKTTQAIQGTWYLIGQVGIEGSTGTSVAGYKDGSLTGVVSDPLPMFNYSTFYPRIGAAPHTGDYGWPLNGDIAEIILYNTNLNDAQRIIVDNYLSAKYNLSIANDYYSLHGADFTQDVQGIGTTDGTSTHKHPLASNGKGLVLAELNNSLDAANEFLLAGHNSPTNSLVSTDLPFGGESRWSRVWYVEKTGGVGAKLSFDFSQAGLSAPADLASKLSSYQLLYRPSSSGTFSVLKNGLAALTPTLENSDQLAFLLPDAQLLSGYYTLGYATGLVWTGQQDQEWNQAANWSLGRVPTAADIVIVNACTNCPQLSASVNIAQLQLNAGSKLSLQGYTLSMSRGASLRATQVSSLGGHLQATDWWYLQDSSFLGPLTLIKTGGGNNRCNGGNRFFSRVQLLNASTSSWQLADQNDDWIQK